MSEAKDRKKRARREKCKQQQSERLRETQKTVVSESQGGGRLRNGVNNVRYILITAKARCRGCHLVNFWIGISLALSVLVSPEPHLPALHPSSDLGLHISRCAQE